MWGLHNLIVLHSNSPEIIVHLLFMAVALPYEILGLLGFYHIFLLAPTYIGFKKVFGHLTSFLPTHCQNQKISTYRWAHMDCYDTTDHVMICISCPYILVRTKEEPVFTKEEPVFIVYISSILQYWPFKALSIIFPANSTWFTP